MNLLRYRRNLFILGGFIFFTILYKLYIILEEPDAFSFSIYLFLNYAWFMLIFLMTESLVKLIDEKLKKEQEEW